MLCNYKKGQDVKIFAFCFRYGRKVIIVGTPLVVGTVGLLKSVVFDYWSLLILEFLETALGYGNASLVLC